MSKRTIIVVFSVLFFSFTSGLYAKPITNADIDLHIKSLKLTSNTLDKIQKKIKADDDLDTKAAMAQLEGKALRTMVNISSGWKESEELTNIVKKLGYSSLDAWALSSDAIIGVITSADWVVGAASAPWPGTKKEDLMKKGTNIFAYVKDNSVEPELRKKYKQQLIEMCERMCVDVADLEVVGKRYEELQAEYKKAKSQ